MQLWSSLAYRVTRQPLPENLLSVLEARALKIRQLTIAAIYHAGSGHPGGSLSAADMLACLYGLPQELSCRCSVAVCPRALSSELQQS